MDSLANSAVYTDDKPLFESCKDLETLRKHEDLRELEIPVKNGGIVWAHKIILAARIPILRTLVNGRLQWDRQDVDLDCAEAIISYAYTGKLFVTNETIVGILSFSLDLQLDNIVDFCCNFVNSRLTLDNLSLFWSLSNNKGLPTLRTYCLNAMKSSFETFVSTPLFIDLQYEDLKLIISADDLKVDDEESVFKAIRTWIQAECRPEREEKLTDLVECIRWSQTSSEFRNYLSENDELVGRNNSCLKYLLQVYANPANYGNARISFGSEVEQNLHSAYDSLNVEQDKTHNVVDATSNEEIFLIFGQPSSGDREWIAERFDPETRESTTLAHVTLREWGATVVSIGRGNVMFAGGDIGGNVTSSVEVFSYIEKKCRPVASLKVARRRHGACAVDDDVVVCGGIDGRNHLNSCEVYSEGRWRMLPRMKEARFGVAVVSAPDRRVFAIGGSKLGDRILSSVEVCLLPSELSSPPSASGFWNRVNPMRVSRRGHAAVFFQGCIFVAGGYEGDGAYLSSVEMMAIANEDANWITLPRDFSMNEKRRYFSLVASSQGIFAFGSDWTLNTVEMLSVKDRQKTDSTSSSEFFINNVFLPEWEAMSSIDSMEKVCGAVVVTNVPQ